MFIHSINYLYFFNLFLTKKAYKLINFIQFSELFNLLNCIYSFFIEQRRNYKNVFNAFARIAKEEGITTLWRGSVATMGRAVIVNISQLATYSQAKFLIATKSYYEFLNFLIYYIHTFIIYFFLKEYISNISYINELILIEIVYIFFIQ